MEYLVGAILGAVLCTFAVVTRFDRDRVFYPTVLTTIATYYILFAVMGNSTSAIITESLVASAFALLAVVGFRRNLWVVAAGTAGHGVFDFFLHHFIQNPGMPVWWPGFCGSIDVFIGAFLALLLVRRSGFARAAPDSNNYN